MLPARLELRLSPSGACRDFQIPDNTNSSSLTDYKRKRENINRDNEYGDHHVQDCVSCKIRLSALQRCLPNASTITGQRNR